MTPKKSYPTTDMVGQVFDSWTVLSFDRYSGKETMWMCKCSCGTLRPIKKFYLVHRRYKSCGCLDIPKGWIIDGIGYIPLTKSLVVRVSPHRVDELQKRKWRASKLGGDYYAYCGNTRGSRRNGHMARQILGLDESDVRQADHINGDTLDNRDENLRPVDKYQSIWNRGVNRNNSTGAKGVIRHKSWGKYTGKFRVRIMHMGVDRDLGVCDTVEEGRNIYNEAALKLYGEFARVS